jgi:hypothetical protein
MTQNLSFGASMAQFTKSNPFSSHCKPTVSMQFIAVSLVALVGSAAAFAPVSQSSRSTTSLNAFTVSLSFLSRIRQVSDSRIRIWMRPPRLRTWSHSCMSCLFLAPQPCCCDSVMTLRHCTALSYTFPNTPKHSPILLYTARNHGRCARTHGIL